VEIEHGIHEYIITLYLLKALHADRKHVCSLKLEGFMGGILGRLILEAEARHQEASRQLRQKGCRILLEEVLSNRNVHVRYVFRGFEHHCVMMPSALRSRCEQQLKELLHRLS
jgi:hypothetical protein